MRLLFLPIVLFALGCQSVAKSGPFHSDMRLRCIDGVVAVYDPISEDALTFDLPCDVLKRKR